MSNVYLETTVCNVDNVVKVLTQQDTKMSKLLVEVVGKNNGVMRQSAASKIYQLYIKLGQAHPKTDVQINVESLKGRSPVKPFDVKKIIISGSTVSNQHEENTSFAESGEVIEMYRNVVLGGTFDRLHVGHKILLTEAVLRCKNKLTVGVTDESMIKSKKLWELIEPTDKRINNVLNFLQYVDSGLTYEVVPISDMFGPTQSDPDLDLLVVSAETERGGHKVNEVRNAKGLTPLTLYTVALVESENVGEADEKKISSSNGRLRLLGTRLRQPEPKPNLRDRPYIIGLTGGIASGKSSVGRTLTAKGVGLVDCDKVAHALYRQGTSTYEALIKLFGPSIIAQDGEVDRRVLGNIVFNSKEELEKLNHLLWPAILEASVTEAYRLYEEMGNEVVVLEAAVLLRAGWYHFVHEVWTCIVPPDEAISRIVNRNGLTKEAAQARLAAQPNNCEQVAIADVVFCTLYSYEFTRAQVDRAWTALQSHLVTSRPVTKL